MTASKKFRPGRGYTKKDWDAVDNPEPTDKQLAKAKPFKEVFPELAKTIPTRGPQKKPTKQIISIRLSAEVLSHYKSKGPGWQSKIDEDLKKLAKRKSA